MTAQISNLWKSAQAVGIPDRADFGDLSKLPVGELLNYVVQVHRAERAGEHRDLRFGGEAAGGLHSWAVPKGIPEPGSRALAVRQPLHDPSYADFQGAIPKGEYGAGTVSTEDKGKVIVQEASPDIIRYTLAHRKYPEQFTMVRTKDGQWLLMNRTPMDAAAYAGELLNKPHYKSRSWDQVKNRLDDFVAEPKANGASQLFRLGPKGVEALSYRIGKGGRPLIHTQRIFHNGDAPAVPEDLVGTVLRGELLGFRDSDEKAAAAGTVISPQELGGLLNSSLAKSIEDQKARNIKLRAMLYGIVGDDSPPTERHAKLQRIAEALGPRFFVGEQVEGEEAIRDLWERVRGGQYPLTSEGLMLYPKGGGDPFKLKAHKEFDVFIRKIHGGKNRLQGTHAGAFSYSMTPDGPILGVAGSGLTDETRASMFQDPDDYLGRKVVVKADRQTPTGALYAPVVIKIHEDYPTLDPEMKSASGLWKKAYSRPTWTGMSAPGGSPASRPAAPAAPAKPVPSKPAPITNNAAEDLSATITPYMLPGSAQVHATVEAADWGLKGLNAWNSKTYRGLNPEWSKARYYTPRPDYSKMSIPYEEGMMYNTLGGKQIAQFKRDHPFLGNIWIPGVGSIDSGHKILHSVGDNLASGVLSAYEGIKDWRNIRKNLGKTGWRSSAPLPPTRLPVEGRFTNYPFKKQGSAKGFEDPYLDHFNPISGKMIPLDTVGVDPPRIKNPLSHTLVGRQRWEGDTLEGLLPRLSKGVGSFLNLEAQIASSVIPYLRAGTGAGLGWMFSLGKHKSRDLWKSELSRAGERAFEGTRSAAKLFDRIAPESQLDPNGGSALKNIGRAAVDSIRRPFSTIYGNIASIF